MSIMPFYVIIDILQCFMEYIAIVLRRSGNYRLIMSVLRYIHAIVIDI